MAKAEPKTQKRPVVMFGDAPPHGAGSAPAFDQEQLAFILQQKQAAKALRASLERQRAQRLLLQQQRLLTQEQQRQNAAGGRGTPAAGRGQGGRFAWSQALTTFVARLPGGRRSEGRTALGRAHNNLADLPIMPFVLTAIAIAIVLIPVSQGYTRLDLLFMTLSGDAALDIPLKGPGQNFQQALQSPPDTSGGNTGAGNPNFWQSILGGVGGALGPNSPIPGAAGAGAGAAIGTILSDNTQTLALPGGVSDMPLMEE